MQPQSGDDELVRLRAEVMQLRTTLRGKDAFIALAAHELRNPMTPLLGLTELAVGAARRDAGAPHLLVLLEKLHTGIEAFIGRSTRLLDGGQLGSGVFNLRPEPLDLSRLVLHIAETHKNIAAGHGSLIELQVAPGITGAWDRPALTQIIENLLSNALKYGGQKPVAIRLATRVHSVELEVEDHGIGLDALQQAQIFGGFEQVVGSCPSGGLDLGLWAANRLATAMQGRLSVHSRCGAGARFTVVLPITGASQS